MATDSGERLADARERPKPPIRPDQKWQAGKEETQVKRILVGLMAIALVVGLVGAGITAYFSDTEESTGNVFQAGTLDLVLEDMGSLPIVLDNMEPGVESGYKVFRLRNVGSLPGVVSYTIAYTKITGNQPDGGYGGESLTADAVARKIYVTEAWFDRYIDGFWDPVVGSYGTPWDWETWEVGTDDPVSGMRTPYGDWEGAPHGGIGENLFADWVLPDWARWADTDGGADGYLSLYEIAQKTWTVDDTAGTPELDPGQAYTWQLKFMLDKDVGNQFQAQGVDVTITFNLDQK